MNARPAAAPPTSSPVIRAFVAYIVQELGLSANTALAYRRDLERAERFLAGAGGRTLRTATPSDLVAFVRAESTAGIKTSTLIRRQASLCSLLHFLEEVHGVEVSAHLAVLERPKEEQALPKVISRAQVDQLLAAPDPRSRLYARDVAALELLYASGLRASELCELRLRQLDFEARSVRVLGKGSKERVVPFGESAKAAMLRYLSEPPARAPNDLVFRSRTGKPLERVALWMLVERYGRKSGLLNAVSPHTLRHCFASHLMIGGADLRVIQELLGHADVTTTQVYTHLDTARLKAIHARHHPRA